MHNLSQLQKQQVGLRLPKYLIEEIDSFTKEYALNRTEIITEAIVSYIQEQKSKKLYKEFETATKELQNARKNSQKNTLLLDELIDELADNQS